VPNLSTPRNDRVASPDHATVLIVDREALYRWFVAESLHGRGIDVVPCRSLDEATDVLHSLGVAADLLLVDGDLMRGRGGDTFHALSQRAAMRCVVLDDGGDRRRAGASAMTFADKPVDADAVVRLVTGTLADHTLPA
jgi:DNA-binding NtrC family response regulator